MKRLFARARNFLRASRAERELAREVHAHLSLIEEDYRRRGLSPDDARLAAKRTFGGVEQAKEAHRDARSFIWLEQVRQDIRYACRSLARTPGFAAVVVLTLAVGIGANTAIFSVIHGVLLKSLPYPDADRLVRLIEHVPAGETRDGKPAVRAYFSLSDFETLADRARTLSAVATYGGRFLTMVGPKGAMQVEGAAATPALFKLMGAQPVLGRLFTADDIAAGRDHLVLISYRLWQTQFDGDPRVLGKSIGLQALLGRSKAPESYTVVGVMSSGFRFPEPDTPSQLWTPLSGQASFIMARLAPGVRLSAAQAEVSTILSAERHLVPSGADGHARFELLSARSNLVAPIRPAVIVLAVAAGFVLLIACVNVANLLLARTMARQQEIAIRVALGAERGRVIRHLLTESVLMAAVGGLAGIAVAFGGVWLLRSLATTLSRIDLVYTSPFPRLDEIVIDGPALTFTAVLALATGIIFGWAAAVRSSAPGQMTTLRGRASDRSGISALRRLRARGALVVAETALAMMLLVGGGLLIGSFAKLADVDPGYNPDHALTFQVALAGFSDQRLEQFAEHLRATLVTIPGVRAAAFVRTLPMASLQDINRVGSAPASPADAGPVPAGQGADIRPVSAGYFAALGMRMIEGRALNDNDGPGHPRALVINQALARRDFSHEDPVGHLVYIGHIPSPWTIVGVAQDVHEFALDRSPQPDVFVDARWIGDFGFPPFPVGPYFLVRTAGDPVGLLTSVREAARSLDSQASLVNVASMDALISNSLARPRLYAVWLGIFAGVALLLAAVGVYGVLAYAVEARTREIGIRRALGAQTATVLGLVLRQSLTVTALGLVIGLVGAAVLTRYLSSMLYGLTPLDPTTFAGAAAVLAAVALVASYIPARRATRVDPQIALRSE